MPRLRRARLDLSLARAPGTGLSRIGSAREPRPARRGVGRRRALLPGRPRGGRGRCKQQLVTRQHRSRAARHPLLLRYRPTTRHRAHGLRQRRDGPLPPRLERAPRRGSSRSARTASSGRCSRSGRRDEGVLRRSRPAVPHRLHERRHEARAHSHGAAPAARASRPGGPRLSSHWRSSRPSGGSHARSSARCSTSSLPRRGRRRQTSASIHAVREYDRVTLERGPVRFGPWTIESDVPALEVRTGSPATVWPTAAGRCRTCSRMQGGRAGNVPPGRSSSAGKRLSRSPGSWTIPTWRVEIIVTSELERGVGEVLIDADALRARIAELGTRSRTTTAAATCSSSACSRAPCSSWPTSCAPPRALRGRLHGHHELRRVDRLVGRRTHPQGPRHQHRGRHVLVVEDIVDSGLTLSTSIRNLESREPASLEVCAPPTKPARREIDVPGRWSASRSRTSS